MRIVLKRAQAILLFGLIFAGVRRASAWDAMGPTFPTQDVVAIQSGNATDTTVPLLGYYPVTAILNPFGAMAPAPAVLVTTGFRTGKPSILRATLALVSDVQLPFPVLFPDFPPTGAWTVANGVWASANGDTPAVQRQYELLVGVNPTSLATPATAGSVGAVSHIAPATVSTTFGATCPGFAQPLVLYSAYGNAMQSFLPKTLADEGPLPALDERAWPLPYDFCVKDQPRS